MHCHFQCANSVIFKTVSPSYEMTKEKKIQLFVSKSVKCIKYTTHLMVSAFTMHLRKSTLRFLISHRLSVWNNSTPTEMTSVKFYIEDIFTRNLSITVNSG
jgi:hypothetical protein